MSVLVNDISVEEGYASGHYVGENSEPLLCRLEDGVVYSTGRAMVMFCGDPLMKRITEIFDRVVEAGLFIYWISFSLHQRKLHSRMIANAQKLDEYYSFSLTTCNLLLPPFDRLVPVCLLLQDRGDVQSRIKQKKIECVKVVLLLNF